MRLVDKRIDVELSRQELSDIIQMLSCARDALEDYENDWRKQYDMGHVQIVIDGLKALEVTR